MSANFFVYGDRNPKAVNLDYVAQAFMDRVTGVVTLDLLVGGSPLRVEVGGGDGRRLWQLIAGQGG